jgi:hypothetical protein
MNDEFPDRHQAIRLRLAGTSVADICRILKALHIHPLPSLRTIERVLSRNGLWQPKVKLSRFMSSHTYPTPQADESNDLHELGVVGPIHRQAKADEKLRLDDPELRVRMFTFSLACW